MFNYHIYQKKIKEKEGFEAKKEQFLKQFKKREIQGKRMIEKHQKRIMDFIVNMNEQPLTKPDYGVYQHSFRDEKVEKFLGPSKMTFNDYQDSRRNMLDQLKTNQNESRVTKKSRYMSYGDILDNVDQSCQAKTTTGRLEGDKKHQFRDRDVSKEIHSNHMIFNSDNLENVKKMIKNQPQKYLVRHQNYHQQGYDQYVMNKKDMESERRSKISQIVATQFMPDLNEKFHFKSVATLYNNLPSSLKHGKMENNMNLLKMQNEDQDLNYNMTESQSRSQLSIKFKEIEQQNRDRQSDNTKQILKNCGILNDRSQNVKVLFKGQGISSSNYDMSIDEIYKIINQSKN